MKAFWLSLKSIIMRRPRYAVRVTLRHLVRDENGRAHLFNWLGPYRWRWVAELARGLHLLMFIEDHAEVVDQGDSKP